MTAPEDVSDPSGGRRRRRRRLTLVSAVLAVLGVAVVVAAIVVPGLTDRPPQPTASEVGTSQIAPPTSTAPPATAVGPTLAASVPTELDVPAIGVHSPLLRLGLNPDNTVQVPPLERDSRAGWFTDSPTPGQTGPAVLLGHVDSAEYGPGVFYRLGALQPGQTVEVTRSDATVAEFTIDHVESYAKDAFPSLQVYGNTPNAQLRLITCGGVFDPAARSYENNIVVYAHLVSSRPA